MSSVVVPYRPEHDAAWDAFVASSRNGTFFHTRKFLSYHPAGRFQDASLCFYDGATLLAVLPAAIVDGVFVSHPGASYGGLVLSDRCGVAEVREVLDALDAHLTTLNVSRALFARLPPSTIRRLPSDEQEYWLHRRGWTIERAELDSSILVPEGDVMESLDGKCRNMVRQAERGGVSVRQTEEFDAFWPMLEGVLASRHNVKPTHTLAEIRHLHALAPETVRLFGAYAENRLIGGIVTVVLAPHALYTLYMAQDFAFQRLHPLHAILFSLLELCQRERRRVLHLGVSTEDRGRAVNDGLFFFKESFGARHVRRESWERVL